MPRLKPQRKTNVVHAPNLDAIPEGARILLRPQEGPQWDLMLLEEKEILFGGAKGGGKAAPLDSKVLTPFGFRRMGDLKVGSIVSNPDGGQATVIGIYPQGKQPVYKFTFADGATTRATADHLWLAKLSARMVKAERRAWPYEEGETTNCKIWTTGALIDILKKQRKRDKHGNGGPSILVPLCEPVSLSPGRRGSGLPPYVLGVLLGDGCLRQAVEFCTTDSQIAQEVEAELGITLRTRKQDIRCELLRTYVIDDLRCERELRKHGLWGKLAHQKFIPDAFKLRSVEDRFAVLQGLMDTDGYVSADGKCSFTSTSEKLAKDVQWIARSLGFKATITSGPSAYTLNDGTKKECRTAYTVYLQGKYMQRLCRLRRKRERLPKTFNGGDESRGATVPMRRLISIEPDGIEECQCIAVDHPNHLYIADDFIVTHNTQGARIWALKGNPYESQDVPVNVSYVYHPGYRCLVLRKNNTDMLDYIDKAKSMYAEAYGAVWNGDGFFEFPSGAKIVIGHMSDENSYMKYMGQEWTRIIIEEVTQIASKTLYLRIFSCCRTVFPEMKTQILLTANPEGPGFYWVKERFMHDPKTGKRVPDRTRIEEVIENPFTGKKDIITRIFLPSKVSDNKILLQNDPGYVTMLMSLPESLRQAYLEGNWDVIGGKYFPEFRPDGPLAGEPEWARHCVDSAEVWMLPWFRKWCGIDIGYNHWMVCHWFFESEDDNRIYVYRTLRVRLMGMQDFGELWAKHTLQDLSADSLKAVTIWMSHDAFHKRDASPSAEDISPVSRFLQGVEKVLGPKSVFIATQEDIPEEPDFFERLEVQKEVKVIVRKAPMHRQGSSEYVRELMSWRKPQLQADAYDHEYALRLIAEEGGGEKYLRYLQRHIVAGKDSSLPLVRIFNNRCKDLVRQISDAVYAEDRLNILKVDCNPETGEGGDDDLQAFIYGLSGWRKQNVKKTNEPIHIQIQKRVHEIHKKYGFQLDGSQLMQVRWQAETELRKGEGQIKSVHIPRRSSKWRRPKQEKPLWDGSLNVLQ